VHLWNVLDWGKCVHMWYLCNIYIMGKKCSWKFCTNYPMWTLPCKRTLYTQSTLVITEPQGCRTKITVITKVSYILGPDKLPFKITLKVISFNLCLFLVLLHKDMNRYILYIQKHILHTVCFSIKNRLCSFASHSLIIAFATPAQ
jgi:hypothetical protein